LVSVSAVASPFIPSIPTEYSKYQDAAQPHFLGADNAVIIIVLNILLFLCFIWICVFLIGEAIEELTNIMLGERFENGIGTTLEKDMKILTSENLSNLGISDSVSLLYSQWIRENRSDLQTAQENLRSSGGRILSSFFVLTIALYHYFIMSDINLYILILFNALVLFTPYIFAFSFSSNSWIGYRLLRPVNSICKELDNPPMTHIRIAIVFSMLFSLISIYMWSINVGV